MITKYEARVGLFWGEIKPVEVERETESSVWISGRRQSKRSSYQNYFDSWEEARAFKIEDCEREVAAARRELEYANSKLGNIKGMKKP
jgi:hypothetical protein